MNQPAAFAYPWNGWGVVMVVVVSNYYYYYVGVGAAAGGQNSPKPKPKVYLALIDSGSPRLGLIHLSRGSIPRTN